MLLTDSTGRYSVRVPEDWTDTDVRPAIRDDGGRRPTISASPDLDGWLEGWAVPGMFSSALPADVDPATLLRGYNFGGVCHDDGVVPYSDGRFSGLSQTWSECGGGATSVRHVAARSADNSFAVFVQIQLTSADDPAGELILGSLAAVPGANPGEESPISPPAAPVGEVPDALLQGPIAPGALTVTDELGEVSIAVPATWTEIDDGAGTNDDFSRRAHLLAAPSIAEYRQSWAVEGLEAFVFPYRPDPNTIIQNRSWSGGCDDGGLQSLTVRDYVGLMQTWTNCGGTPTRMMAIAVAPPDQSATLYIEIQLPTADDSPLVTALASLELT
jgi:hypothetical protein